MNPRDIAILVAVSAISDMPGYDTLAPKRKSRGRQWTSPPGEGANRDKIKAARKQSRRTRNKRSL